MQPKQELVESAVGAQTKVRRVLIMEDNDNLRNLYSRALCREGYEIQAAATLQEARDILAQCDFDVFLCDIHMGEGLVGPDLLREQGDVLKQKGTQIIIVSAEAGYHPITGDMGVEFYWEKPVALGSLVMLVDWLTAQR
ncbi:MAG: response regulator [Anaerolineae bacterium]